MRPPVLDLEVVSERSLHRTGSGQEKEIGGRSFCDLGHQCLRSGKVETDVAISLTRPQATSVLNILEGEVIEIDHRGEPRVDILLDVGQPLIARVTQKSVHDLGLVPGQKVFALVKAVAIDRPTASQINEERQPQFPSD